MLQNSLSQVHPLLVSRHPIFSLVAKQPQIQLSSPLPFVSTPAAAESTRDTSEQLSAQAPALDQVCNFSCLFGVASVEGLGFSPCTAILGTSMPLRGGITGACVQLRRGDGQLSLWDPAMNPPCWLARKQCAHSFIFFSSTKTLWGSKRLFSA